AAERAGWRHRQRWDEAGGAARWRVAIDRETPAVHQQTVRRLRHHRATTIERLRLDRFRDPEPGQGDRYSETLRNETLHPIPHLHSLSSRAKCPRPSARYATTQPLVRCEHDASGM